jgi:hypothetical protein
MVMRLFEIHNSLSNEIKTFPFMRKTYSYSSSPLNFERKSGIKVAQHYKMPEGLSVEDAYKYYSSILSALDSGKIKKDEANRRIKEITDSVMNLNPELATIANSSNVQDAAGHVLIAALSLFPIQDIRSYVVDGKTSRWYATNDPTRYPKTKEIEELTGAPIHWVMSDNTLNRVYAEVCKKYKK